MKKMNKKGNAIGIAIFVVLGVVVISIAVAMVNGVSQSTPVVSDQFTASNSTCVDITSSSSNCILSQPTFANATSGVAINAGNFSLCNNRGGYNSGILLVANSPASGLFNGKVVNTSYTEIPCTYVSNGIVQTLMPYLIVLLALIVFAGVAKWVQEQ